MQEERKMCHQQKAPLRPSSVEERDQLEQLSRSLTHPADQVIHAKEVLAVADGHSKTLAAKLAGRTSGEAVAPLPARFNAQGLPALETRHGGGPPIRYSSVACERILREFRRAPDRRLDGTAIWSLVTLRRALRRAPDGLPKVSTDTVFCVVHEAGYSWQQDRTWCDTGKAIRVRKSGTVEVTDPDVTGEKTSSSRPTP
jgi:transposase